MLPNGIEWLVRYFEETNTRRPTWLEAVLAMGDDREIWGSLPRQNIDLREENCTIISIKYDKLNELAHEEGLNDAKLAHGMLLNWIIEKLSGPWNMTVMGTFLFADDNDATMFKMTWFG